MDLFNSFVPPITTRIMMAGPDWKRPVPAAKALPAPPVAPALPAPAAPPEVERVLVPS